MTYRTEIDGIRAIAVMSVVLYHAGFTAANSGYAGVDVFFVISGFLIGTQIIDQLAAETFSFREFYKRRARRILPALYLVILVSFLVGAFTLIPRDIRYFGGAAFSTLLFASNVWFMERIDYFNPQAAEDPLVHTWSLGIEEQFYILAPLVLFLLWRHFRLGLPTVLWTAFLASLTASVLLSESHPESSFYLLHTRAWELLSGVLVAWYARHPRAPITVNGSWLARFGAWLGFALLVAGVTLVPTSSPWPGTWAILPVAGTVLLLVWGNTDGSIRWLLSSPPMRFVGLISYSAYLWHQPVFSFLDHNGYLPGSSAGLLLVIGAILLLSTASWRYVEIPFRRQSLPRRPARAALWISAVCIAALAVGGHVTKGYPERLTAEALGILAYTESYGPDYERCVRSRVHVPDMRLEEACVRGAAVAPTVAIWGDSHAARLADPLGEAVGNIGMSMVEFTVTSCLPVPGLINHGQTRAPRCPEFNDRVMSHLVSHEDIGTVVLFATWDNYFSPEGAPNLFGDRPSGDSFSSYPLGASDSLEDSQRRAAIVEKLHAELSELTAAGKRVVLVASLPRPDVRIPEHLAKRVWNGEVLPAEAGYPREYFDEQTKLSREMLLNALGTMAGVKIILPEDYFCDQEECLYLKDGHPLFSDGNHPTLEGSALIIPAILDVIGECPSCAEPEGEPHRARLNANGEIRGE